MSYIEKNLMNGETVLYRTSLHWIIFVWPVIWLIFGIFLIPAESILGVIALAIGFLSGLAQFIKLKTSEFAVTNKRVIVKVGFIQTNSLETLLSKIEGIHVNQGIMGKIFNYGSITISGTGGARNPFHKIKEPFVFRKKVQEQIEIIQNSK